MTAARWRRGSTLPSRCHGCWTSCSPLSGRVRPYNTYLPWELHTHPVDGWPADELLVLVQRSLDGDVGAIRETFGRVRAACAAYDERRGHARTSAVIDEWGDQLAVFA